MNDENTGSVFSEYIDQLQVIWIFIMGSILRT